MGFGNLSVKVSADIGQFTTNLDLAGKAAQENMAASSLAVGGFRRDLAQSSAELAVAAQKMSSSMAAANDAIMHSATSAAGSIQNIADTADKTDFRSLGEKIAEAIGTGVGVGIAAANKAWDGFVAYSKTKAAVVGAAVSLAFAAVGLGAVYTAYKVISGSMGFIAGLITGDSYKGENIDALIAANDQVKEIQKSLSMTAQQAAATNEALAALGVDKGEYLAVYAKANDAIKSNKESLDALGLSYGTADELIQSANAKLNEYTEGWDRNSAAAQMGLGTAAQIAQAARLTAAATAEASARLNDYNLGIGTQAQEAAKRYTDTMREFNHNMDLTSQGFKRAIADNIMPVLTDLADFFKDGFPIAVNAFRYTIAGVTSLFYGLKTSVYIVAESIVGALSSVGSVLLGVVTATIKSSQGDFLGARDALVKGWEDGGKRLNEIGGNIVAQAQHNAAAMRQAWALDDRAEGGKAAAKGKSFVDPEIAKKIKAQADEYRQMANAITEKTNAQQLEIQLNDKLTEGQRKAVEFTTALANGTSKLTDAQKKDYAQRLEALIAQEKINKQLESARKDTGKAGELSDYQRLTQQIREKIAVQDLELASDAHLTEGQKLAAKVMVDFRDDKLKLTAAEKKNEAAIKAAVAALLEQNIAMEEANKLKAEAVKMAQEMAGGGEKMLSDLDAQIKQQKDANDQMGLSKAAIEALVADKIRLAAASDDELAASMRNAAEYAGPLHDAYVAYANSLELAAEKKRALAGMKDAASAKQEAIDIAAAAAEQAKAYETAYQASNKKIGDGLYEALSKSGDAGLKKLLRDAKEWFARLVLSPIISPIAAFGAALINPLAGSAQGSLGAAANGIGGLSGLMSIGSTISAGFAGVAQSIGTGIESLGATLGSGLMENFGIGMQIGQGGLSGSAVAAGLEGASAGSTIATAMPYIAAAAAVYLIGKAAFGMGDKQITGTTISGTIGTDNLYNNASWSQQGGWLRSDRSGVWSRNLATNATISDGVAYYNPAVKESDAALLAGLNEGYAKLKTASADYAKALGIDATAIAGRTDQINFALGKDGAETQANITKMFAGIGDKIAGELLGSLSTLAAKGESASATLTRLATEVTTVDQVAKALGLTFAASGFDENLKRFFVYTNEQMIAMKDGLVKASGGLQTFATQAQFFAENFLTDAEKIKPAQDAVNKTFAQFGISGIASAEQFKKLIQGLDLSTDAGQKEYASLMALAPAFLQVVKYTDSLSSSLDGVNKSLQQQIDDLLRSNLTTEQQRQQMLVGVDESTAALYRRLWALQEEKSATEQAATAMQAANAKLKAVADEKYNLETRYLQLTGNTAELQQRELDKLDPSNRALLQKIFSLEKEQAAQQATAQAAQAAAQAAQQLTSAWQGVTDSILGEVNRLRGVSGVGSANAYADTQSKFAIATAQARAGDANAAKLLPQLSQTLDTLALQNASSAVELARSRAMTANSLEQTALSFKSFGVAIPGFAAGGDFGGGLRLVGENGPELEVTGPARIYSAAQTSNLFNGGDAQLIEEVKAMRREMEALRMESRAAQGAIAISTNKTARVLQRNDTGVGLLVKSEKELSA